MRKISLLLCLATLIVSCNPKDDNQLQALPSGSAVSIDEIVFDPLGGSVEFTITSPTIWSIENIQNWLTVKANDKVVRNNEKLASGHYVMEVSTTVNDFSREVMGYRHTTLIISSDDDSADEYGIDKALYESILITQPNPYMRITTTHPHTGEPMELTNWEDNIINFLWDYTEAEPFLAEPMQFTVECNTNWNIQQLSKPVENAVESINMAEEPIHRSIESYAASLRGDGQMELDGWLIAPEVKSYPENNETNVFSFYMIPSSYNTTGKDRSLRLRIFGPDGNYKEPLENYTLSISQDNVRFNVTPSNTILFGPCYTTPVEIVVDSEIDWEVENDYGWITLDPSNPKAICDPNSVATSFTVDINHPGCSENANPEERQQEGHIRVIATGGKTRLPIEVPIVQEAYTFQLSTDNLHLANNNTSRQLIDIISSGAWHVESCPDWLTASPSEGNGFASSSTQLIQQSYIKANSQNLNLTDNVGTVVFQSSLNSLSQEISVTQDRFIFEADIAEEDKRLLTMDTTNHDISIMSSGDWSVTVDYEEGDEGWLLLDRTSGNGNGTLKFHAASGNDKTYDRKATIIIESTTHSEAGVALDPIEIGITQRKYEFEVSPEPAALSLKYGPVQTDGYTIDIVCSATWSITTPDWIVANTPLSGSGDAKVTFTAFTNKEYTPREGVITIKSVFKDFVNTFTYDVHQDEFIFNVTPTLFEELAPVDAEECSITIDCSSAWTITTLSTSAGWVIPTVTKGNGSASVRVEVGDNPLTTERSGDVMVFSTTNEDSRNIVFKQKRYEFDSTPVEFDATTLSPQKESVDVVCSGEWTLSSKPAWVAASPAEGKGNATIELTISNNYTLAERTSDGFTLLSTLNELSRPITITQSAFVFDTEAVTLEEYAALVPTAQSVTLGDIMASWELHDLPAWMSASMKEGTNGGATITFTAQPNYTLAVREATIKVKSQYWSENNELCKEIYVSQQAFAFPTETITHYFPELSNLTHDENLGEIMASWEVTNTPDWLTLTPTIAGEGQDSWLHMEAQPNYQRSERTAELKIQSEWIGENPELSRTYNIHQAPFTFENEPVTATPFEPVDASTYTVVQPQSSASWSLKSHPDWLSVELSPRSDGQNDIILSATDNILTKERNGEVVIESEYVDKNSELRRVISVSQKEYLFDDTTTDITAEPLNAVEMLDVVCSGQWTISGIPTWVSLTASGKGSTTLTATFENNYQQVDRKGSITLTSTPNGLTRRIDLTQKPYLFDTSKSSIQVGALASGTTVHLSEASASWSVKNLPDWLSVSPTSGSGEATLTISVEDNAQLEGRNATFRIESVDIAHNANLYKEVSVTQAAFEYDTAPVILSTNPALDASAQQVTLSSSTATWSIKDVPSWLEVAPMSGNGAATITIKAKDNTITYTRRAIIRIESDKINLNSALYKEVEVSQEAYEFDTQATTLNTFAALNAASQSVQLTACTGSWKVNNKPEWITLSAESGSGKATITVKANNNTSTSSRDATFTIVSSDNSSLAKSVSVKQEAYEFSVESTSITFEASTTKAQSIAVTCTGDWSASASQSWLTATKSGSNVVITPTANKDKSERKAVVTLTSKENASLSLTINVTQAAAK